MIYIDRMHPRTFMSVEMYSRRWKDFTIEEVKAALEVN
jgi:hypothetical protein